MLTFSIIIPTFGRPDQLRNCLDTLVAVDPPGDGFEVIVVDDGTPEPLEPQLKPWQDQLELTVLRQENAGPGPARNLGLTTARGRFIAFTDDDCLIDRGWLQALETAFEDHPEAMLGGRTTQQPGDPYSETNQLIFDAVHRFYNESGQGATFFPSNNMAISAEPLREVGGFDPQFFPHASEDRELCDRWRHLGHDLLYVPEAHLIHARPASFQRYWRQHFTYGRGAHHYHRLRAERGSGQLRDDAVFHRRLPGMLQQPLGQLPLQKRSAALALLVIWQLANAAGYFKERFSSPS
jgi:GT2 family glycosyltransferase